MLKSAYSTAVERIRRASLDGQEHAVELRSARSSNVSHLPPREATIPLEGDEDWISTE